MKKVSYFLVFAILVSCNTKKPENGLKDQIKTNEYYAFTKDKALLSETIIAS